MEVVPLSFVQPSLNDAFKDHVVSAAQGQETFCQFDERLSRWIWVVATAGRLTPRPQGALKCIEHQVGGRFGSLDVTTEPEPHSGFPHTCESNTIDSAITGSADANV